MDDKVTKLLLTMPPKNMLNAKQRMLLLWTVNILMVVFFTLNSLGTCIVAALTGIEWENMTLTKKFLLVIIIIVNWSSMMMAFFNRGINHLLGEATSPIAIQTEPK